MIKHIAKSFTYATNVNIFETHTALKFETKYFRRMRVKDMLGGYPYFLLFPLFDITLHLHDFIVVCSW